MYNAAACQAKTACRVVDCIVVMEKRKVDSYLLEDSGKRPKIVAFTLNQLEEAGKQWYSELVFASCTANEHGRNSVLKRSRRGLYIRPPLGLASRVQVIVDQNSKYDYQVLIVSKEKGTISTVDECLQLCDTKQRSIQVLSRGSS